MKNILLLLCGSLIIFSACANQPDKTIIEPLNLEKDVEHQTIRIDATKVECHYIEPIRGELKKFSFSVKEGMLEDVLNDWILELTKLEISYGCTASGENILDVLSVVDAYFVGNEVVIVMNDSFSEFESSNHNNYTDPGNFLFGLKDILSKITDTESMTIDYKSKKHSVIGPEGYFIDGILLEDKQY